MKRAFKFTTNLALALVAVAISFVVLFFLTPSWQLAIIEKALAKDEARQWQLGSVRVKPTGVELGMLQVLEGPIGAEIQHAELDGPIWMSPFGGVLSISSGNISGMTIDLEGLDVGSLKSSDWRAFVEQVRDDPDFWRQRTNLVLSKLTSNGWNFHVRNLRVDGTIRLPGNEQVPVHWVVVEADSRDISKTQLERASFGSGMEL